MSRVPFGGSGNPTSSTSTGAAPRQDSPMVDEMFDGPTGHMEVVDAEDSIYAGGPASSLINELNSSEKTVHSDFFNNFGAELFDDSDLN